MLPLSCFSTALPSTGQTWPWLHYLPLLSGFCSVGFLLVIGGIKYWKKNRSGTETPSTITKLASQLSKRLRGKEGSSRYAPVWFSLWFALFAMAAITYGVTRVSAYSVTTEHDIAVIGIHGPYRFTWQKVDSEGNLYGDPFTHDVCRDFVSPEKDFLIGIILNKMIHTDEGDCWSLNPDKGGGYFKRRDAQKNAIYARMGQ